MLKRDPIFWWATGIFFVALLLFWSTQNQFLLALMIVSYLLRPTLASLGIGRKHVDERQMSIHYRSGNIAFAVTLIACVIFAAKLGAEGNHDFELFAMVIIIGIATKALFNVLLVKDFRRGATKILIGVGLLMALFGSFANWDTGSFIDIFMNMLPGLAIACVGLLSKVYPRPAAVVILVATALLLWLILSKGFTWAQIGTAMIVGVPMIAAALCLFSGDKAEGDAEPKYAA